MCFAQQSPGQHLERSKPRPGAASQLGAHAVWLVALEEVVEALAHCERNIHHQHTHARACNSLHYNGQNTAHCTLLLDTPNHTAIPTQREVHTAQTFGGIRSKGTGTAFDIGLIEGGRSRAPMHVNGVRARHACDCGLVPRIDDPRTSCIVLRSLHTMRKRRMPMS